jgi:hypothetical protein
MMFDTSRLLEFSGLQWLTFKSNDCFCGFEAVIEQPEGGGQDTARGEIRTGDTILSFELMVSLPSRNSLGKKVIEAHFCTK